MIASAADKHRPVDFEKHVSENFGSADAIVHVNTHRSHAHTAGMVNEIVADLVPAKRVVSAGIDRSHIAGLQRNVMNLIKFHYMIVTPIKDGAMRVILNEIVRCAQADTTQRDRRHIALGPATLALEMAVLDKVPAGRERLAITARQRNAAITRIKYITANDTMSNAAFYDYAAVADVANEAAGDAVARAVMNFNGTGARGFKSK